MGLWDVLRGRTAPQRPNLDSLFAVPGAAITLQTALGMSPTGTASVCYRAADGAAMAATQADATQLIQADGTRVERRVDGFGFTWLIVRGSADDVSALVTDLHAVNTDLENQGFGSGLLCSLVAFESADARKVGLVYLYKQGTFYPFSQLPGQQLRDSILERQVRDAVAGDLPMESDPAKWLPLWDSPGLA